MKIYSIIVTYANRGSYVEQLVNLLFNTDISKIIIVDNNSDPSSIKILDKLQKKYKNKINIIHFQKNTGTAYAFKIGMKTAYNDKNCDFIWILDDDNFPEPDALNELKKLWVNTKIKTKNSSLMLTSFRPSKPVYKRAVVSHRPDIIFGERNYFRAFHLAKIKYMYERKNGFKDEMNENNYNFGEISAAPYGGMFFNKKLLNNIGFPDEKFYIYCDDHEFSHRLILRGGKILLSLKSIINDVDGSWNSIGLGVFNIAKHCNKTLLYYAIRNRVYLELKITVNNYITYFANAIFYSSVVFVLCLFRLKFSNFLAFWRGFKDGLKGRMGINKKYVF